MSKKIKQILLFLFVIFLLTILLTGILYIWNFIELDVAKDAVLKITYTLLIIGAISVGVGFLTNKE